VIALARALSMVPSDGVVAERAELERHFSKAHAEWLVVGIAMMGFLNKFMDAIGVELEETTVDEVAAVMAPSGWTVGKHGKHVARADAEPPQPDTLGAKLGVLPYIPAALSFDKQWTRGVPARAAPARAYLRTRTGHDFPILERLHHGRAIRAITTMLCDNLDPSTTVVGLETKIRQGAIYARIAADPTLAQDVQALAKHHGVALDREGPSSVALSLARAVATSPAVVNDALVEECRALKPAEIVESVVWLSVLQMLHRITLFYGSPSLERVGAS
jgi:hypothetical protein